MKIKSIRNVFLIGLISLTSQGHTQQVGLASYTESLLGRQDISSGNELDDMQGTPKVSSNLSAPFPTTDWWSSLIWSFQNRNSFSENMFPHPLSLKTQEAGLDVSLPSIPRVYNHEWDGKILQRNSGYQYSHQKDFTIGVQGQQSSGTVVDDYSDWAVTALWQGDENQLKATFGHGLPFVYFSKNGSKPINIEFYGHNQTHHFSPFDAQKYVIENVNGLYNGASTTFSTYLDAQNSGLAAKIRVSYDFEGDGDYDRVELYGNFATNAATGVWEIYNQSSRNGLDENYTYGDFADMQNGKIKFEIWKTEGQGNLTFRSSDTSLVIPFTNSSLGSNRLYTNNDTKQLSIKAESYNELSLSGNSVQGHPSDFAEVWYQEQNVIAVTVNNHNYAFFAPSGSSWTLLQNASGQWVSDLSSDLSAKEYFSLAVLPDNQLSTLLEFKKHAFSFVKDTVITYEYDQDNSKVITQFNVTFDLKERNLNYENTTLLGLYRHQWINSPSAMTDYTYKTSRGEMKLVAGNSFSTEITYHGVLPSLPVAYNQTDRIRQQLVQDVNELKQRDIIFQSPDTYWRGKEYARVADLAQIAEQLGEREIYTYLVEALRDDMTNWLTDSGTQDSHFYYYNNQWGSLIGYP
ncbi:MAG: hypothetical protein ACJA0H_001430, partial [Francisellaceae bacterium]